MDVQAFAAAVGAPKPRFSASDTTGHISADLSPNFKGVVHEPRETVRHAEDRRRLMADFKLPSGRIVETHQPLFGEFIKVVSTAGSDLEELVYAKFAVIVPGIAREEIEGLDRDDGLALLTEVGRIWEGRTEAAEIPLSNGGPQSSMESSLAK